MLLLRYPVRWLILLCAVAAAAFPADVPSTPPPGAVAPKPLYRDPVFDGAADPVARIAGHNVKLGQGGIREIEFLVQTIQLIWAGRDPGLRDRTTLGALKLLAKAGHVPRRAARELAHAYTFLRQVEHRLQMVNDRQTHVLPEKPEELTRIALFLGLPDAAAFAHVLLRQLSRVRAHYRAVFEILPSPLYETGGEPGLDFRGDDPAPAATVAGVHLNS